MTRIKWMPRCICWLRALIQPHRAPFDVSRPPGDGRLPHAAFKRCLLPTEERPVAATWGITRTNQITEMHTSGSTPSKSSSCLHMLTFIRPRHQSCSVVRGEEDKSVVCYAQGVQPRQHLADAVVQLHHRIAVPAQHTQLQSHWLSSIGTNRVIRPGGNVPASLAFPQEMFGGVDRSVSGIDGPVEEEGTVCYGLTENEIQTFLQGAQVCMGITAMSVQL